MADRFGALSDDDRDRLEEEPFPERPAPMLAVLTEDYFSDPGWVFERKLDGVRCLALKDGDEVRLVSRNHHAMNGSYPELVEALEAQSGSFVVDGEVVAFDGDVTSFSRLQARIGVEDPEEARSRGVAVYLYLFDLLHLDGRRATALPLRARKALLRRALDFDDPIRFTPHRDEDGEAYREEACEKGWEGVIAKAADAPYVHGRSRRWLKFKCSLRQELVVVGFTDPKGSREGLGALLVGYHEGDALEYAGKVGTGFNDETLRSLRARLEPKEREEPPVDGDPKVSGARWVEPELVAEIGFTEWTRAGRLRHPRFLGLRPDKEPSEVVRERPRG